MIFIVYFLLFVMVPSKAFLNRLILKLSLSPALILTVCRGGGDKVGILILAFLVSFALLIADFLEGPLDLFDLRVMKE